MYVCSWRRRGKFKTILRPATDGPVISRGPAAVVQRYRESHLPTTRPMVSDTPRPLPRGSRRRLQPTVVTTEAPGGNVQTPSPRFTGDETNFSVVSNLGESGYNSRLGSPLTIRVDEDSVMQRPVRRGEEPRRQQQSMVVSQRLTAAKSQAEVERRAEEEMKERARIAQSEALLRGLGMDSHSLGPRVRDLIHDQAAEYLAPDVGEWQRTLAARLQRRLQLDDRVIQIIMRLSIDMEQMRGTLYMKSSVTSRSLVLVRGLGSRVHPTKRGGKRGRRAWRHPWRSPYEAVGLSRRDFARFVYLEVLDMLTLTSRK